MTLRLVAMARRLIRLSEARRDALHLAQEQHGHQQHDEVQTKHRGLGCQNTTPANRFRNATRRGLNSVPPLESPGECRANEVKGD